MSLRVVWSKELTPRTAPLQSLKFSVFCFFCGVDDSVTLTTHSTVIRYWISINWVSISMFQKTSQIRSGRKYSNVIEFWVLIYHKFNGIGLRFLFITSVFPPTTIEEDLWWVILVIITVGIILMVLLVPPRIHLFTYNHYIVIPVVGYANYIVWSGPWCLESPFSILIRRDNP